MKFETFADNEKDVHKQFKKKYPNIRFDGVYSTNINNTKNIFTDKCPIADDENCRACKFRNEKTGICEQP